MGEFPGVYTQKDVMKELDLPRWMVQYYSDKGIVKPGHGFGGRGSARRYDKNNLMQFYLIKVLADWGLQARDIESVIRYLSEKLMTVRNNKPFRGRRFDEIKQAKASCFLIFYKGEYLETQIVIDRPLNEIFDLEKVHSVESFLVVDFYKIIKRME